MKTGIHRPSKMVPSEYRFVLHYHGATMDEGWPIPSFGVNCELDWRNHETGENGEHSPDGECCVIGLLRSGKKVVGDTLRCTVCGTHFTYGEIWQHVPTGEYIHIGHICAHKYGLFADSTEFDREMMRRKKMTVAKLQREANQKAGEELAKREGLVDVLEVDHSIIRDIRFQLFHRGYISEAQIKLVRKLAREKEERDAEIKVAAPTSKAIKFTGKVVSDKFVDSPYGTQRKITVKVVTKDGVWLAWGSAPASLCRKSVGGSLRDQEVSLKADLQVGEDAHFAFMKRPREQKIEEKGVKA